MTAGRALVLRIFVLGTALLTAACDGHRIHGHQSGEAALREAADAAGPFAENDPMPDACSRLDGLDAIAVSDFESSPFAASPRDYVPFRCLRFLDQPTLDEKGASLAMIDTRADSRSGGLRIPLFEIKAKTFLKDRPIAILSDGKHYAALEKECGNMKAAGISDVFAVLTPPRKGIEDGVRAEPMLPRDFIAERNAGIWHVVNRTGRDELPTEIFDGPNIRHHDRIPGRHDGASRGLQRTLIVYEAGAKLRAADGEEIIEEIIPGTAQVFVLEGGLANLRQYRMESSAMSLALARPRIGERGCAG